MLGVVIGIVAIYTQQYYMLFTAAMMIAGGAYGLTYKPKTDSGQNAQQDMRVATASLGNPIPVIFGECRVTPNFIRIDPELMTVTENRVEQEGGKGGGVPDQLAGYNYFVPWEQALCMGPVDMVGTIYSMPGEVDMLDLDEPWEEFDGDGRLQLVINNRDEEAPESGVVLVYNGRADQVRLVDPFVYSFVTQPAPPYSSDGIPYQNVCWAQHGITSAGFFMGHYPQPKTYQYMLRRLPKCYRDDATIVTDIKTRGSDNPSDPSYWQANAAAIIYEIITNKLWGRGLSSDIIDEDSFAMVSEYLAAKNIGLSLILEAADNIADILDGLFRHCKVLLTWDGEYYKLICLLDQRTTHGEILSLNESDLRDFQVSVPTWEASTTNELRGEFTSRERGYRPDVVHHQDLANIDILNGRSVVERITLPAFADFNLAFQQLARILSETSYPFMTAEWNMNRFGSNIQVGNVVRIVWEEFTGTTMTSYWLVLRIQDGASGDENIKVTAIQDQLLAPILGEELDVDVPNIHPWERVVPVDPDDVYVTPPITTSTDQIVPSTAFELPAILMGGNQERTVVTGEKVHPALLVLQGAYSTDDDNFLSLGSLPSYSITGTLQTAMRGNEYWNRGDAGYEVELTQPDVFTSEFTITDIGEADDLNTLTSTQINFLIVGDELMQVGWIEHLGAGVFKLRNIIRGRFGTKIRHHAAGVSVFFLRGPSSGFDTDTLVQNIPTWFMAIPVGHSGATAEGISFPIPHEHADNDGKYLGLGRRPLEPRPVSATGGGTVVLTARPRYFGRGAGVNSFNDAMNNPETDITGMTFAVQQFDDAGDAIDVIPVVAVHSFTAPTLSTPSELEVTFTRASGAVVARLYSRLAGQQSAEFAEFAI